MRRQGFTLVEAVVALAVLSLSLSAILALLSGSAGRVARAVERERATLLAQSVLEETLARPFEPGEREGSFEGVRWRVRQAPSDESGLVEVALLVSWPDGRGGEGRLELASLRRAGEMP